jgi:hypothetical protein
LEETYTKAVTKPSLNENASELEALQWHNKNMFKLLFAIISKSIPFCNKGAVEATLCNEASFPKVPSTHFFES